MQAFINTPYVNTYSWFIITELNTKSYTKKQMYVREKCDEIER